MWTRRRLLRGALALGLGAVWPAAGGCTPQASLRAVRQALTILRAQRTTLLPPDGYREFRGALHAHTGLSHDSTGTVEEILAAARVARLDFLITTDHYNPRIFTEGFQGLWDSVLVLRGLEAPLGCSGGKGLVRRCGSVLAIGLKGPLDPGAYGPREDLLAAIRAQGALALIAHSRGAPEQGYFDLADGMEIFDIGDTLRERLVDIPRLVLDVLFAQAEYPDEVFLPLIERSGWNLARWDRVTRGRRFVGVAGHDAHQNLSVFGRVVDRYDLVFRALNTHVLAPSLTAESLVSAIRAGRCFSSFNLLADASGFGFAARDGEGGPVVGVLGDEVPMREGLVLIARSPIPGALDLLRDGVPIRRQEGRTLRHTVDRPGVYRVEVSLRVVDRWRPWIFANPIYVRA